MIKCITCGLTREEYKHRQEDSPEHAARLYLRDTCTAKYLCKFKVLGTPQHNG
jgi:hypothetical protein